MKSGLSNANHSTSGTPQLGLHRLQCDTCDEDDGGRGTLVCGCATDDVSLLRLSFVVVLCLTTSLVFVVRAR